METVEWLSVLFLTLLLESMEHLHPPWRGVQLPQSQRSNPKLRFMSLYLRPGVNFCPGYIFLLACSILCNNYVNRQRKSNSQSPVKLLLQWFLILQEWKTEGNADALFTPMSWIFCTSMQVTGTRSRLPCQLNHCQQRLTCTFPKETVNHWNKSRFIIILLLLNGLFKEVLTMSSLIKITTASFSSTLHLQNKHIYPLDPTTLRATIFPLPYRKGKRHVGGGEWQVKTSKSVFLHSVKH